MKRKRLLIIGMLAVLVLAVAAGIYLSRPAPAPPVTEPVVDFATLAQHIEETHPLWDQPAAVTVLDGRTFVLDTGNNRILEIGSEGEVIAILDESVDEQLALDLPMAITSHEGLLYVANSLASQIVILNPSGQVERILQLEKTEDSDAQLPRPVGIAVTPGGDLVISDADNHRVLFYDGDGQLLRYIGTGDRDGSDYGFNVPAGIEVDEAGNVFVVDMLNGRVMEFSPEGDFLQQFGEPGDTVGTFSRPKDVAVDEEGRVYVSDALLYAVEVFSPEAGYLTFVGREDPADENSGSLFWAPAGIEIVGDKLYVVDRFQGLFVFELDPEALTELEPTPTEPSEPSPPEEPPAGPPNTPAGHYTEGCKTCHEMGLEGAPAMPTDHTDYMEEACPICHQPAGS